MAKASPSQILDAIEACMTSIVFDSSDLVAEADRFTPVRIAAEIEAVERDRVFAVVLLEGPYSVSNRSRCRDAIRCEVAARYFFAAASRARMVEDAPRVRRALRAISTVQIGTPAATVPGDPDAVVDGPFYDYSTMADVSAVLMRCIVTVAYEAEA